MGEQCNAGVWWGCGHVSAGIHVDSVCLVLLALHHGLQQCWRVFELYIGLCVALCTMARGLLHHTLPDVREDTLMTMCKLLAMLLSCLSVPVSRHVRCAYVYRHLRICCSR
jgi:hypothetical protein